MMQPVRPRRTRRLLLLLTSLGSTLRLGLSASLRRARGGDAGAGAGVSVGAGAGSGSANGTGLVGGSTAASAEHAGAGLADTASARRASEAAFVNALLSDGGVSHGSWTTIEERARSMDLDTALGSLQLPQSVVTALRQTSAAKGRQQPAAGGADSVQVMNDMLLTYQERLDQKVVECKEFLRKSEKTAVQTKAELARLGQQLANNARVMTTAMSNVDQANKKMQALEEQLAQQELAYHQLKKLDGVQFEQRSKDLNATEFLLDVTMCKGGLLQRGKGSGLGAVAGADGGARQSVAATSLRICYRASAGRGPAAGGRAVQDLLFDDARISATTASLSPETQQALRLAVGSLGRAREDEDVEGDAAMEPLDAAAVRPLHALAAAHRQPAAAVPAPALPSPAEPAEPVPTIPPAAPPGNEAKQAQKCVALQPGCGVLHDAFAALWGDLKDLVEDSREKLHQDDIHWQLRRDSMNSQRESLAAQKGALQTDLAEATSAKSSLGEQQTAKQEEDAQFASMITQTQGECKAAVQQILFTDMASTMKVRNALVEKEMPGTRSEDVVDCQVSDFVPEACSVLCDNSLQGGTQILRREILVKNTALGAPCANLTYTSKCNEVKCPVDCQLSSWSAFSKCTKECDGGVQARTRVVERAAESGGRACDALTESRACSTGSCDRNCKLSDWTEFTTCSKVCGSGYRMRKKEVLTPARANGLCPAPEHPRRSEKEVCNEQACSGDEVCIANMDLVLAIDGSGSVTEEGFETLKTFAAKLAERFQGEAFGQQASRVGVVQFGNGKLDSDRVVSEALFISELNADAAAVSAKIKGMKWQKGFTNLAQGLLRAKDVLFKGRAKSEHVVMVLTDGRPTFKRQTRQTLEALRSSARVVIVHVQAFRKQASEDLLKSYASTPWQTNYMHIPGKEALRADFDSFVGQTLVEVCPRAYSPSARGAADQLNGFALLREGAACGPGAASSQMADSPEACKEFADQEYGADWQEFSHAGFSCEVYKEPCQDFKQNASTNIYERLPPPALPGVPLSLAHRAPRRVRARGRRQLF